MISTRKPRFVKLQRQSKLFLGDCRKRNSLRSFPATPELQLRVSYINPAIDRWAKESTLAGKIPMYRVPITARINASTEAGENWRPVISLSDSLKYISTVTRR